MSSEPVKTTDKDAQSFLLQRVQPAMTGLIDGSLSTLAPIFSVVIATHDPTVAESADGHALMDEGRLSWLRRL